jgi:hypothetical protein
MTSAASVPQGALGRDPEEIRTSEANLRRLVGPSFAKGENHVSTRTL